MAWLVGLSIYFHSVPILSPPGLVVLQNIALIKMGVFGFADVVAGDKTEVNFADKASSARK